jgi:hypothetical protein
VPGADPIDTQAFLYNVKDVWRFTVLWTIIVYMTFNLAACGYAMIVQRKNWKFLSAVTIMYVFVAGVEALLAGSIVGLW